MKMTLLQIQVNSQLQYQIIHLVLQQQPPGRRENAMNNDPIFMQLVGNLSNTGKIFDGDTESMQKLAKTFKHEADMALKRMKVYNEIVFQVALLMKTL